MKPQLRFKEFTDEWEEKKLGEIADVRDGTHSSPKFVKEGYPLITSKNLKDGKLDYSSINYISKYDYEEINKRSYVENNDILMAMIGTIGNPVKIVKEKEFAIKNVALIKDKNRQNNYLIHYLQSNNIKKQFLLELAGGTQKFISLSTIRNIKIQLPSLLEQEKIGKFFSLLDQRIEKQERKVALLKEEKKGYMQKLFKQGLRFKDEQGNDYPDWEEKKFLDSFSLIIDYRGKTPKKLGLDWGNGNIKALSALNVKKGYIDWNADVHMGSEDLYSAWMKKGDLKQDDILFTTEAPLGNTALIPDNKKYILSQRVIALRTNENCNPKFIFQCMNDFTFENQIQKRSTGTTAKGINQKGLSKIKIQLPSLPEQEKIANFLSLLDQRIEKEQEKLKLMKEEKQGLMQRMFV